MHVQREHARWLVNDKTLQRALDAACVSAEDLATPGWRCTT
ncbi:hypothetical protein ACFY1S_00775 [Micromonospora sp. NPDC000663]